MCQVSFVGLTEEQAREKAAAGGWEEKVKRKHPTSPSKQSCVDASVGVRLVQYHSLLEGVLSGGVWRQVTTVKTSFKANSKALAEKEGEGMAKMIYRFPPAGGPRPPAHPPAHPAGYLFHAPIESVPAEECHDLPPSDLLQQNVS